MKITTYKSILTDYKTQVVLSVGKCGHADYREAIIFRQGGQLKYYITNGYKHLTTVKTIRDNLKSAINIIEGYISPKPWYSRGI